ncbi:MAG TPA: PilZ domain-containing protein [Thermodesulfovibrionales bacterium]|nr:PilZ domain-containing protein [Thermodesulfovibrionales bacterium]
MDKRRHPRFIRRLAAKFIVNNESYTGISSDFSENGLFIRTNRGCSANNHIDIELIMPDNSVSSLKGIVRRTKKTPIPSIKNGMGIEITERDRRFVDFLRAIAEER